MNNLFFKYNNHFFSIFSLPEHDVRSKYMTVPIKPPDVRPEDLYKLPKRVRKPDGASEEPNKYIVSYVKYKHCLFFSKLDDPRVYYLTKYLLLYQKVSMNFLKKKCI